MKQCEICGKDVPEGRKKYCSNECYYKANKLQTKKRGIDNREYCRNYYQKNKESRLEYYKKYRRTINGKLTSLKYHNKRRKIYPIDVSLNDLIRVMNECKCHCIYCGIEVSDTYPNYHPQKSTVDHIIIKHGTAFNNLVLSCRKCNCSKNDKDVFEWCKEQGKEVPELVLRKLESQNQSSFKIGNL